MKKSLPSISEINGELREITELTDSECRMAVTYATGILIGLDEQVDIIRRDHFIEIWFRGRDRYGDPLEGNANVFAALRIKIGREVHVRMPPERAASIKLSMESLNFFLDTKNVKP